MEKLKDLFRSIKEGFLNLFSKRSVIENTKFVFILIAVYVGITLALTYIPFLQVYNTYTIRTDSMEPVLMVGDVVFIENIDPKDVQVDDIIAFYIDVTNDGEDDVIIHYIDEIIQHDENTLVFKSRPEVSNLQDRWTIEETDIIGVYKYKIDDIGKILLFLNSWIGRIVLLVDIVLVWIIVDLVFPKKTKEILKETEEETKEETVIE